MKTKNSIISMSLVLASTSSLVFGQAPNHYPSTGAVGIGTATPSATTSLDIQSNVISTTFINAYNPQTSNDNLNFFNFSNGLTVGPYNGSYFKFNSRFDVGSIGGLKFGGKFSGNGGTGYDIQIGPNGYSFNGTAGIFQLGKIVTTGIANNKQGLFSSNPLLLAGNSLTFNTNNVQRMSIDNLGALSINTSNLTLAPTGAFVLKNGATNLISVDGSGLLSSSSLSVSGVSNLNGKVSIGTQKITSGIHTDYKLSVDGKIVTKSLFVTTVGWADYVFATNYSLKPLKEVESYILANHHLPNVPSATEVEQNGLDISDMQRIQMEKIEELTLYLIELKKENELLQQRVELLEKTGE
jgi:hypothetical protein